MLVWNRYDFLKIYTSSDEPDIINENCIFTQSFVQQFGGGLAICWLGSTSTGNTKFNKYIIYNNKAYYGSGLVLYRFDSTSQNLHFTAFHLILIMYQQR